MPRTFIPRENSISRDLSFSCIHGCSSVPQARKKGKTFSLLFLISHPPQIVAIGRNYLDHVKELGNAVPNEPFFFLKPTSSYLPSQTPGAKLQIPRGVLAHHEGFFPPPLSPYFHLGSQKACSRTWPGDRIARSRHPPRGRAEPHCRLQSVLKPISETVRIFLLMLLSPRRRHDSEERPRRCEIQRSSLVCR